MPKFNGTGPMGYGPGTGRGLGPCCAKGYGRRFRRFSSAKNEIEALKEEKEMLKNELKAIDEDIDAMEKENK